MSSEHSKARKFFAFLSGFFFCLFCVIVYFSFFARIAITDSDCMKDFPLTSRALDCNGYDISAKRMHALDAKFDDAASTYVSEGKAARVSIWARNLETKLKGFLG